jgi:hypothetical protein
VHCLHTMSWRAWLTLSCVPVDDGCSTVLAGAVPCWAACMTMCLQVVLQL